MAPTAYYNEYDRFAAAWLRELIAERVIAHGIVDERSITEVQASDLEGFTQCHFFAGIGVWSYALRCAGWPDARPVWTASCPCPPFSTAGKKKPCPQCGATNPVPHVGRTGYFVCCACDHEWSADERHLFPELWRLVAKRRPVTLIGEQVASADGRTWLATVRGALEILGYAVGAADTCAAGVGAPHIRQRLYFVADADQHRWEHGRRADERRQGSERDGRHDAAWSGASGAVADADSGGAREHARELSGNEGQHGVRTARGDHAPVARSAVGLVADTTSARRRGDGPERGERGEEGLAGSPARGEARRMADANDRGLGSDGLDASSGREIGVAHAEQRGEAAGPGHMGEPESGRRGRGIHEGPGEARGGDDRRTSPGPRGKSPAATGAFDRGVGDAEREGPQEREREAGDAAGMVRPSARQESQQGSAAGDAVGDAGGSGREGLGGSGETGATESGTRTFWDDARWVYCRDDKWRCVPPEPTLFPLAPRTAGRVGVLRGAGNALCGPQAQAFIEAFLSLDGERVA